LVSKNWKKINKKLANFVKFTLEKQKFPKKILVFLSKIGEILPKQKNIPQKGLVVHSYTLVALNTKDNDSSNLV